MGDLGCRKLEASLNICMHLAESTPDARYLGARYLGLDPHYSFISLFHKHGKPCTKDAKVARY